MHFQGALLVAVLLLLAWVSRPDGRLHVIFLATAGDAALVQTPAGGYVLIDGGADPSALTAAIGRRMPFWRRTLDAVVLTAADPARLPGQVAALARYHANLAIIPAAQAKGATFAEWRALTRQESTRTIVAQAGLRLNLGGVILRVLTPGDSDGGMVLRLDYGTTSVVLDHSGSEAAEQRLVEERQLRPATLVAYPWQRDPHTPFLAALRPSAMVLTDGSEVETPLRQTMQDRAIGGAALYHERLHGEITWISDGRRAWIETEN